jgi:hypothetical protein
MLKIIYASNIYLVIDSRRLLQLENVLGLNDIVKNKVTFLQNG